MLEQQVCVTYQTDPVPCCISKPPPCFPQRAERNPGPTYQLGEDCLETHALLTRSLGRAVLLAQNVDQIGGLDQPIILLVVFGAVLTFLSLCGFLGACCAIQRDGRSKIDGCCADRALMIYYVGILTGAAVPSLSHNRILDSPYFCRVWSRHAVWESAHPFLGKFPTPSIAHS